MTYSVEEYAQEMVRLQDQNYYTDMSNRIEHKYKTVYDYTVVKKQLLQLTGAI
jgi:hypothetical protein